jgi:hypothetical protein
MQMTWPTFFRIPGVRRDPERNIQYLEKIECWVMGRISDGPLPCPVGNRWASGGLMEMTSWPSPFPTVRWPRCDQHSTRRRSLTTPPCQLPMAADKPAYPHMNPGMPLNGGGQGLAVLLPDGGCSPRALMSRLPLPSGLTPVCCRSRQARVPAHPPRHAGRRGCPGSRRAPS